MATFATNLIIQGAPLDPAFVGTPQEFYEEILKRLKVVSPFGFTSFVIGSVMPTSNQGPWLKDGTQWWVWDNNLSTYVPLDTSASVSIAWIQEGAPTEYDPPLWIQINGSGEFVAFHVAIGTTWTPLTTIAGTTASRPARPYAYQQYYDQDIETLIWYERGQWRTVSGVIGDVKFVTWSTAAEALLRNPGWEIYGTGESNAVGIRGRVISQATQDSGSSPATQLTVGAGITPRAPGNTFGEETHTLTEAELASHDHVMRLMKVTPDLAYGNHREPATAWSEGAYPAQMDQSSYPIEDTGSDNPHNNIQPTVALWCLRKT